MDVISISSTLREINHRSIEAELWSCAWAGVAVAVAVAVGVGVGVGVGGGIGIGHYDHLPPQPMQWWSMAIGRHRCPTTHLNLANPIDLDVELTPSAFHLIQ